MRLLKPSHLVIISICTMRRDPTRIVELSVDRPRLVPCKEGRWPRNWIKLGTIRSVWRVRDNINTIKIWILVSFILEFLPNKEEKIVFKKSLMSGNKTKVSSREWTWSQSSKRIIGKVESALSLSATIKAPASPETKMLPLSHHSLLLFQLIWLCRQCPFDRNSRVLLR